MAQLISALLLLIVCSWTLSMAQAKSITMEPPLIDSDSDGTNANSSSSLNATISPLFHLPTTLNEYEVLEELGRLTAASINQSNDPCEDFYEYACGNWQESQLIPARSRNNTFLNAIQYGIHQMLIGFLGNATSEELKLNNSESKAKAFYASCVQMRHNLSMGYRHLLEMEEFKLDLKAEAMKKQQANETYDWININFLSRHGIYPLLPLRVSYNTETRKFDIQLSTTSKVLTNIDAANLKNLTRDFHIDNETELRQFRDEFEHAVEFEKNLTLHANRRNETERLTLGEFKLKHKADALNWTRYFELASNGTARNDWPIQNTIGQVGALVDFLQKAEHETLRLYLKWRTIIKFHYIWQQRTADNLTESTCREHTEQYFSYALLPWFIDRVYDAERRADISTLAKHIKDTFYERLEKHYPWLDDETRSHAKTKLRAMDITIGYSDELRRRDVIDRAYADVVVGADWYRNVQFMEGNRARAHMRVVGQASILPLMSTRDVNAYYADFLNLAFIGIGVAQAPFYHIHYPAAVKFGGIGAIIAHEMAHGFDSSCYEYNYDGKKQNWWTEASLRNFKERFRCLEAQYNKYVFHGVLTNGTLTLGDNIADNVGLRMAYYAYMNSYGRLDGERKVALHGLDLTNKQLFFVKYAQTWCTGKDVDSKLRRMRTDVHAYDEFRVSGPLQNMPEFSEVFKCKLGSNMNPLKKCVVW